MYNLHHIILLKISSLKVSNKFQPRSHYVKEFKMYHVTLFLQVNENTRLIIKNGKTYDIMNNC